MARDRLVVATRKSELALAQCRAWIAELVRVHPGLVVEELHVTTTGDRIVDRPLADIGGKGLFLKEIEEAIADGRADLAVHSMKDVPPELDPGLAITCVPEREDPRDVVITRSGAPWQSLPEGARVGTSSLRRAVQLRAVRPDLEIVPVRGNVGTRIRKCMEGEVEAVVLARAGLNRLGLAERVTETLSTEVCLPAVGQGALAIEQRRDDEELRAMLAPLQHADTALTVEAERGVLASVEGDCKTPVAAFGERIGDQLHLRGFLASPDGSNVRRDAVRVPWPSGLADARAVGLALGQRLKSAR